jgi:hypothetical protein
VTNHPEHDPDIQHLPFFAISTKFFNSLRSTYYKHTMRFNRFAKFSIKHQHRVYYIIMMFARFNLLFNSALYLATRKKQKLRNLESKLVAPFFSFAVAKYMYKLRDERADELSGGFLVLKLGASYSSGFILAPFCLYSPVTRSE